MKTFLLRIDGPLQGVCREHGGGVFPPFLDLQGFLYARKRRDYKAVKGRNCTYIEYVSLTLCDIRALEDSP